MTNIDSITVPKNLYWKSSNLELSLDEYLGSLYFKTLEYESNDIMIQDLSENQILQATKEFTRRLESKQFLDLAKAAADDKSCDVLRETNKASADALQMVRYFEEIEARKRR